MKYQINKTNYQSFNVFEDNRLPQRSYFISFESRESLEKTSYLDERYKSDAVTMLSGKWDFAYFKKANMLKSEIDTDTVAFDEIPVPSVWQKTGYDQINYLNSRYQFRCSPPKTPKNCPVGVYRKKFNLSKQGKSKYIITFLGACASLDLYLNGQYIGYSEGSHNTKEFDLTNALKSGENELLAVVYKWSTGSYLECQDMFRENGIFRDVYISEMPESYIFDYSFTYEKKDGKYQATLKTKVVGDSSLRVSATLLLNGKEISSGSNISTNEIKLEDLDVIEWNAEIPTCYDLVISLLDNEKEIQLIRQTVGFKTIRLDGCKYYFNEKLIKLKGVNHHDSHPVRGYAMTGDDLIKDIEVMKEYNVNCVRTSHYPPDPFFIELCNRYGIYVVDEADIETHGCFMKGSSDIISDDPKWKNHYLDRVKSLYERDKNNPSIVMWSLGNEAGGIKNFDTCYEYLKTVTDIPVHYEPACRSKRIRYDILAHFYTPTEEMKALARGEWKGERNYDAPFFLCEYSHSMGVGPGDLGEYWNVIYSDDRFLGGCIWEFCDHAHYDENAKYKYTYGGDHKEKKHDNNFCCDGLFYPDRRPSSSALCMKNVYSPILSKLRNGKIILKNTNRFKSSDYINISYYLLLNGEKGEEKVINPSILPEGEYVLDEVFGFNDTDDTFVIFEYTDKITGQRISKNQISLNECIKNEDYFREQINFKKSNGMTEINHRNTKIVWNKNGELTNFEDNDKKEMINQSPVNKMSNMGFIPNLYNAIIDNHSFLNGRYKAIGLNSIKIVKKNAKIDDLKNTVTAVYNIKCKGITAFTSEVIQKVNPDGSVLVTFSLTSKLKRPIDMPRIGLSLEMSPQYKNVEYYGMGDVENHSDFKEQSVMGVYKTTVNEMYVQNIMPQESGNRAKIRWARVTDEKGRGLKFSAVESELNFKAVDVTTKNLSASRHIEDVIRQNSTIVHIDGFQRGIGSASCGPDTLEKYKKLLHYKETYKFNFKIEKV